MSMLQILLAEDNPADVLLVRRALNQHNIQHQLHVVKDGAEALDFVQSMGKPGNAPCPDGGSAKVTITAEYPMPKTLDDPISVLTGRGTQTIAPGSACTGGGDFDDRFERTGD